MNTRTNRRSRKPSSAGRKRTYGNKGRKPRSGGFSRGGKKGGFKVRGGRRGGGRKIATFDPTLFINKNPTEVKEEVYTPKHTFNDFGLGKELTHTIKNMGLVTPSPIQDQIIPVIMKGKDVVGLAETGTGKTAAFLIPLIEKTINDTRNETLIMAPTRELAIQIEDEFKKLSKGNRLFSVVCVGGMNIRPQLKALRKKNHFIIGTPGRLLDLIERKAFNPKDVSTVVLDEADRMLDMGFIHDMREILSKTRPERHTLFFSATMSKETEGIVNDFLKNPITVSVKKKDVTNNIEQDVVYFTHHNKFETLLDLLKDESFERVLIFGAMKHSVQKLSRELHSNGISSESIHGNKTHSQRQKALKRFKDGQARVLVATDVAARGIHVDNVTHVINYDLPASFEDYVHRIGRTGRATQKGKALTFIQTRK